MKKKDLIEGLLVQTKAGKKGEALRVLSADLGWDPFGYKYTRSVFNKKVKLEVVKADGTKLRGVIQLATLSQLVIPDVKGQS